MYVRLISITDSCIEDNGGKRLSAEDIIVYCARVSNPSNQLNTHSGAGLIKYLIENKHWSPFEMVDMTVEIKTSRAIAQQIIRHKSFSFQEFSQRYSSINTYENIELRKQAIENRQSSTEIISDYDLNKEIEEHIKTSNDLYNRMLERGVSKETARFVLPLATQTTLYMKGSIRSWLTYFNLRLHNHTQKEHRQIAEQIRDIFCMNFPVITSCFNNFDNAYDTHII